MTGKLEDFIGDKRVVHELTDSENKIIMIMGGSDTGKTTLIEHVAHFLSIHSLVGVVDLDMGQSHIGPPTTIAWGKVMGGFENWSGINAEDIYFTGTVTPLGSLLPAVTGAKLMTDKAVSCCKKVLIDTTGLIAEPEGRLLKQHKADILSPDVILSLEHSRELDHILEPFRLQKHPEVYRLFAPEQVKAKSVLQRSRYRFDKITAYFRRARSIELRVTDIPVRFTGESPRSSIAHIINRIASLRDERNRDIALGLIEGIGANEETVRIRTPLADDTKIATMVIGKALLDTGRRALTEERISKGASKVKD